MADPVELQADLVIDGTAYRCLSAVAREALSQVPTLDCELTDPSDAPDPRALLGKTAELTLKYRDGGQQRAFVGTVIEAELAASGDVEKTTRIRVAPALWRLGQRAGCRTFQEKSVPDIAKEVLLGAGIDGDHQELRLAEEYAPREFTVQYRETDLAFLLRLLAEEGISIVVVMADGADKVVLTDGDLGPIEPAELRVWTASGLVAPKEAVGNIVEQRSVRSDKVTLRDYDFKRPKFELEASAEGKDPGGKALEVYVAPGRFVDDGVGKRRAQVLVDSIQAQRHVISGDTTSLRLQPGARFTMTDHPYEPLNQEYLVLSVESRFEIRRGPDDGRREGSGGRFTAIPTEKNTYRPPRVAAARAVPGLQTAITTGPAGSEIHPDEHGRVKAWFHWDRVGAKDETSSVWMRTSQLALGGSMLTPRVGWEVSVGFAEGDPDTPLVFGRMYNAASPPPYALPKHKARMALQTATTPGGGSTNELRIDDTAGSEEMFMNASKDASIGVGNNATEGVGNNETRQIGSNQALNVTGALQAKIGAAQSVTVGGQQGLHVGTFMVDGVGSHSLSIGGSRDLTVGGDHKRTVTGASTLDVGGMMIDLVVGTVSETTLAGMNDSVGAALIELTPSDRIVTTTGSRTETAGAAKVVLAKGARSVEIGADLTHNVAGAIAAKIKANRSETSGGDFMEVAGGAQIVKAANVSYEATDLLSVVMGASTITLTPDSVTIAGTSIKLDGPTLEKGLVVDN